MTASPAAPGGFRRLIGIRGRLVLIALVAAVPMLILALVIVAQLTDSKRQVKNEALLYSGRLLLESVDKEISRYVYAAETLTASPGLLADDLSGFRSEAARTLAALPLAKIQVADRNGRILLDSTTADSDPQPLADADVLAAGQRAVATATPQIGYLARTLDGETVIGITMPVRRDKMVVRQLIIEIEPRQIRALLDAQHLPEGWEAAIADRNGHLVARSLPGEWAGRAISPSWRGLLGREGLQEFSTPEGVLKVSSAFRSQLTGWTIAVGQPKEIFEAPILQTFQLALAAGLIVIVISCGLAAWIARSVTSPIRSLAASATALECAERITMRRSGIPEFDRAFRAFDEAARLVIAHQRALHDSEERISVAQDAAHAGIWEWRMEDNRQIWTDPLFRLYGLRPKARRPSFDTWISVIDPADRTRAFEAVEQAVAAGREFEVQWRVESGAGAEPRWLLSRGRPLRGPDGEVERYVGIVIDITERKHMEEAVREGEVRLLHAARLSEIGRMAAALAHEVNQPLAAVANYMAGARRMIDQDGEPSLLMRKVKDAVEKANGQALRAGEIIRRLREFVGVGDSERTIEDARSVLQDAALLATIAAEHDGITVRTTFADSGEVLVDKIQIQQVVLNLVRNAIEAMAGASPKQLTLGLQQQGGHLEFSVSDTGAGIAPNVRERLFSPFSTTKPGGMGIGLSVCREIVEAHGGKIWADTNPTGGMVFSFTLPLLREELAMAEQGAA
ncbi:ATP-binding protein [Rhodopseudomonas sp. P1]|uniref:sensor histidine kinase n=1 Tax=Rhodopseudomonas sp. P1 TaxID=3434357 RepID=UPI0031FC6710